MLAGDMQFFRGITNAGNSLAAFFAFPVVFVCYRHGYQNRRKQRMSQTKKMPDATSLGERLRWLRDFKELTVRSFAERVDCDPAYLSKLENGKSKNPSARFI